MPSPTDPNHDEKPEILQPDQVFQPGGGQRDLRVEPLSEADPAWSGWDVVRMVVVAVLAIFFFSVLAFEIARQVGPGQSSTEMSHNPLVIVPAQVAGYLVLLAFMYALVARAYGRNFWDTIHWQFPASTWFLYLLGGGLLAVGIQAGSSLLPVPKSLPIDQFFRNRASAWVMAGFGTLLAPLVEELFFRGFLYPVLRRRMGIALGVAITALLFALIHESQLAHAWAPLLMLFCVGLALTITREVTDSVAASTLMHVAYNATLFTMVWIATDHFRHLEKVAQ